MIYSSPRIAHDTRMAKLNRLFNPINKLEAARRQIDCAIRLYLDDGDLLAIHTLAYAALTVLTNYDKAANGGSVLAKIIRENPDEWSRDIANFLKHADRDHDREIPEFPELLPGNLLETCARIYEELTGSPTKEMQVICIVLQIKLKREKEAERDRESWDRHFDEELMLEAARRARITSKALRKAGQDLLYGKVPF